MATRRTFHLQDTESALIFDIAVDILAKGMQFHGSEAVKYCNVSDVLVDMAYELEAERRSANHG